jgi:hypothetical protein
MASRRLFNGAQIEIGSLPIVGAATNPNVSFSATEGADAALFTVRNFVEITLTATEASDGSAFAVKNRVRVTLGTTEASDIASFAVTQVSANPSLFLTATESPDGSAFTVRNRVRVTLGAIEATDLAVFVVSAALSANLGASENADVAAFSTNIIGTQTTTLAATESGDIASFSLLNKNAVIPGGHYGAWWLEKYKKMWEKPQIKEIIEEIKENPQIIEEIPEVKAEIIEKYPDFDYQFLENNIKLQKLIASLIKKQIKNAQDEDDIETLLLLN